MSTTDLTAMTDWFEIGKRTLAAPRRLSMTYIEAIGPEATAICSACLKQIRAIPQYSGAASTRYVLCVDEQGRCASCGWDDKEPVR
ncbi:MAG: hypothetical protein KGL39_38535 [Patescibacteria group bacterium]|nr:hypothetical protein [Patescibacteria group bacterium]